MQGSPCMVAEKNLTCYLRSGHIKMRPAWNNYLLLSNRSADTTVRRDSMRDTLSFAGCKFRVAAGGSSALRAFRCLGTWAAVIWRVSGAGGSPSSWFTHITDPSMLTLHEDPCPHAMPAASSSDHLDSSRRVSMTKPWKSPLTTSTQ